MTTKLLSVFYIAMVPTLVKGRTSQNTGIYSVLVYLTIDDKDEKPLNTKPIKPM